MQGVANGHRDKTARPGDCACAWATRRHGACATRLRQHAPNAQLLMGGTLLSCCRCQVDAGHVTVCPCELPDIDGCIVHQALADLLGLQRAQAAEGHGRAEQLRSSCPLHA